MSRLPFAASVDLTAVIVVLLGGGGVSAVAALVRFKPDRDAVVVSAAQGAVIIQSGVIDALQEELQRAQVARRAAEATAEAERVARRAAETRAEEAEARLRTVTGDEM